MSSTASNLLTPAEYLAIERKAEFKSEYINGRMYAMSGASRRHSLISGNLFREISTQLLDRNCEAHNHDLRVKVSPTGMYTYPDVVALCGEPELEDEVLDTLVNPMMIAEVLSPSTEKYDRNEKFAQYRQIESLREYVLAAQDSMRVEHYRREGSVWVLTDLNAPDAVVHLASLSCKIKLSTIYHRVVFDT